MNEWTIYWITRLDEIKDTFSGFTLMLFFLLILFSIILVMAYSSDDKKISKIILGIIICDLFCMFLLAIGNMVIPTTKQMLLIKGVPAIVNSREASKLRTAMNILLDDYIRTHKSNKE